VTVFNPEAGTSNAAPFTILFPTPTATPVTSPTPTPTPATTATATPTATPMPLPTLLAIAPVSAPVGSPQLTLALTGTNFLVLPHQPGASSVVRWNGQSLTTHPISSTLLYGVLSAAQLDTPGTFNVTVYNPGLGSSNALPFTVTSALPTPTATPPAGPTPTATPCCRRSSRVPSLPRSLPVLAGQPSCSGDRTLFPSRLPAGMAAPYNPLRQRRHPGPRPGSRRPEHQCHQRPDHRRQPGRADLEPTDLPHPSTFPHCHPLTNTDAPSQPTNADPDCHCYPKPGTPGDRLPAAQPDGPAWRRQRGDPGERVPAELGRGG
jgi:hypothetical protein